MVSWHELAGERANPQKTGQVRINTFYETRKKPVWLVLLKLCALVVMFVVGYLLLLFRAFPHRIRWGHHRTMEIATGTETFGSLPAIISSVSGS